MRVYYYGKVSICSFDTKDKIDIKEAIQKQYFSVAIEKATAMSHIVELTRYDADILRRAGFVKTQAVDVIESIENEHHSFFHFRLLEEPHTFTLSDVISETTLTAAPTEPVQSNQPSKNTQQDREILLKKLLDELQDKNPGLNLNRLPYSREDMQKMLEQNESFYGLSNRTFDTFFKAQKLCKLQRGRPRK